MQCEGVGQSTVRGRAGMGVPALSAPRTLSVPVVQATVVGAGGRIWSLRGGRASVGGCPLAGWLVWGLLVSGTQVYSVNVGPITTPPISFPSLINAVGPVMF